MRVEPWRTPGAVAMLGPLARGSGLTGALFRAPVNLDTRASGLSFVIAPGRPPLTVNFALYRKPNTNTKLSYSFIFSPKP